MTTKGCFTRREFLQSAGALTALSMLPAPTSAASHSTFEPSPQYGWRVFDLRTEVEILKPMGETHVWLPLPAISESTWIRPLNERWQGNANAARIERDAHYGAAMLHAQWDNPQQAPTIELVSRVATRDRAVDLSRPGRVEPLLPATRALYTRATELLPTDGLVRETARGIVKGARSDLERARALYEWICENTVRDPKVEGCGTGDIAGMLETGNLSGKCADLSALYVGLARSVGLPARDVYGIRVADSRFGYKSLGKSGDVSGAQHCRAEVWLAGFGWLPIDPADVRKVVLEEQPGLSLDHPLVVAVRKKLFGSWEMNWVAYNTAHDLALPGSQRAPVPYLMYPQAETAQRRLNSLRPDTFRYRISAREVATG